MAFDPRALRAANANVHPRVCVRYTHTVRMHTPMGSLLVSALASSTQVRLAKANIEPVILPGSMNTPLCGDSHTTIGSVRETHSRTRMRESKISC